MLKAHDKRRHLDELVPLIDSVRSLAPAHKSKSPEFIKVIDEILSEVKAVMNQSAPHEREQVHRLLCMWERRENNSNRASSVADALAAHMMTTFIDWKPSKGVLEHTKFWDFMLLRVKSMISREMLDDLWKEFVSLYPIVPDERVSSSKLLKLTPE